MVVCRLHLPRTRFHLDEREVMEVLGCRLLNTEYRVMVVLEAFHQLRRRHRRLTFTDECPAETIFALTPLATLKVGVL
jgi:hypothetical protein